MQTDPITKEAIDYIRELFLGNADGHGFDHSLRVWRNAMMIAENEICDPQIVSLAALLHDADDHKLFATENNANARLFLDEHHIPPETAERICAAINSVSFSKIGAVGIARTFAYGGGHGRPPEDSIAHFHEKLLLLKDMMNTNKAREIAAERHAFMEDFLREWDRETGTE